MNDLLFALQQLSQGHTCVACDGTKLLVSKKRGVAPLLCWLESGYDLRTSTVADRVVGKGAAFLYLLLGVKYLYAAVISAPAFKLLRDKGVAVSFTTLVPAIRNRDNTGFCPIETAVLNCTDPNEALSCVQLKLKALQNDKS